MLDVDHNQAGTADARFGHGGGDDGGAVQTGATLVLYALGQQIFDFRALDGGDVQSARDFVVSAARAARMARRASLWSCRYADAACCGISIHDWWSEQRYGERSNRLQLRRGWRWRVARMCAR